MERKSNYKFAIFITSHGSPNECRSYNSLRDAGYTGDIWIILDNEDTTWRGYNLLIDSWHDANVFCHSFCKQDYIDALDIGMSKVNPQRAAVLYARAAVEDYAKYLKLDYFIVLDDDIYGFRYRYEDNNKLCSQPVANLDSLIDNYITFMNESNSICLSFANDGSFIGGASAIPKILERRSCHTIFLRDTRKEFEWKFAVNEDYVSSLLYANKGKLMFTLPFVQRNISGMNNRQEGMHDLYKSTTDFQRAFYNVIACPWTCTVTLYNNHYVVRTNKSTAYPKIISDRYKRGE